MDETAKAKLALNAANAWKMWSNWVMGVASTAWTIYLAMPKEYQDTLISHLPVPPWTIPLITLAIGIVARIWPQGNISPAVAAAKSDQSPVTK